MTTVDSEQRQLPRTSGECLANGTGHLEELRHDPIGLMEQVESLANERIHIRAEVESGFIPLQSPSHNFRADVEFGCCGWLGTTRFR
jgi:hypothetical protein